MFRVNPKATLGHLIFTSIIQKSEEQGKVLKVFWKFAHGRPAGNQTLLDGCAPWESLITLGTTLGQTISRQPFGLSTVCTRLENSEVQTAGLAGLKSKKILNRQRELHNTAKFTDLQSPTLHEHDYQKKSCTKARNKLYKALL